MMIYVIPKDDDKPSCRGDLGVSDDDIFIYELSMPKYCSNCGCVLDWAEVKNE